MKRTKNLPQVEATVIESPVPAPTVEVTMVAPTEPKAKAKRYAPVSVLVPNAVITYLRPQYHKNPASKTYAKYALLEAGLTVAEIEAKFVEHNWGRLKARNQLRWEIEHGNVALGLPEAE